MENPQGVALVSANAQTRLTVQGKNFGAPGTTAFTRSVLLNGQPCAAFDFVSDLTATCFTPPTMVVGITNVSVVLGTSESSNVLRVPTRCDAGHFGLGGENCTACPASATCDGGLTHPVAVAGFFRATRLRFLQCEPAEACPPGSGFAIDAASGAVAASAGPPVCSVGYGGEACAECLNGFYRLDVFCKKCPDAAWVFILIFVVAIGLLLLLAYFVNKRQINLAGVTIGVDFAQVCRAESVRVGGRVCVSLMGMLFCLPCRLWRCSPRLTLHGPLSCSRR